MPNSGINRSKIPVPISNHKQEPTKPSKGKAGHRSVRVKKDTQPSKIPISKQQSHNAPRSTPNKSIDNLKIAIQKSNTRRALNSSNSAISKLQGTQTTVEDIQTLNASSIKRGIHLCSYNILVGAGFLNANKSNSLEAFSYKKNDEKHDFISCLKLLINGDKDSGKAPIVKITDNGDISVLNIDKNKKIFEKFGLYKDTNSKKILVNHNSNKLPKNPETNEKYSVKSLKQALDHILLANPEPTSRKHPYKLKDYELSFKAFDKLMPKEEIDNITELETTIEVSKEKIDQAVEDVVNDDIQLAEITTETKEEPPVVPDKVEINTADVLKACSITPSIENAQNVQSGLQNFFDKKYSDNKNISQALKFYMQAAESCLRKTQYNKQSMINSVRFNLYATAAGLLSKNTFPTESNGKDIARQLCSMVADQVDAVDFKSFSYPSFSSSAKVDQDIQISMMLRKNSQLTKNDAQEILGQQNKEREEKLQKEHKDGELTIFSKEIKNQLTK